VGSPEDDEERIVPFDDALVAGFWMYCDLSDSEDRDKR
jgi:hypothetical protein